MYTNTSLYTYTLLILMLSTLPALSQECMICNCNINSIKQQVSDINSQFEIQKSENKLLTKALSIAQKQNEKSFLEYFKLKHTNQNRYALYRYEEFTKHDDINKSLTQEHQKNFERFQNIKDSYDNLKKKYDNTADAPYINEKDFNALSSLLKKHESLMDLESALITNKDRNLEAALATTKYAQSLIKGAAEENPICIYTILKSLGKEECPEAKTKIADFNKALEAQKDALKLEKDKTTQIKNNIENTQNDTKNLTNKYITLKSLSSITESNFLLDTTKLKAKNIELQKDIKYYQDNFIKYKALLEKLKDDYAHKTQDFSDEITETQKLVESYGKKVYEKIEQFVFEIKDQLLDEEYKLKEMGIKAKLNYSLYQSALKDALQKYSSTMQ